AEMSSLVSDRKRSARRALFPTHPPNKVAASSSEMRLQPVLMPRKRKIVDATSSGPSGQAPKPVVVVAPPPMQQPQPLQ
ncbi:hypothetical protein PENTCL1PPCAC_3726, partial [Pristionchus entomophagus]